MRILSVVSQDRPATTYPIELHIMQGDQQMQVYVV